MVTGEQLRDALISGANAIAKNKTAVDELNIFPVPDGDTGTNMSMTMMSAAGELQKLGAESAEKVAATAASALLRGARGNSGVILSLLFRGFSKGLTGKQEISGKDFVDALELGVEAAYKAVMKPTEGTILTVARVAAEKGKAAAEENDDAVFVWAAMCEGAAEALATTPELLPVLKKAGVVDAGGKGLTIILNGMLSVFRDGIVVEYQAADTQSDDFFRNAAAEFDQEINFTYCTEFIVGRNPEIDTEPQKLRAFLETIGDCVLVVDDDEIIKVHVHTEAPGNALEAGLAYGQLLTVKIENMKEQHRKAAEENEQKKAETVQPEKLEPVDPEDGVGPTPSSRIDRLLFRLYGFRFFVRFPPQPCGALLHIFNFDCEQAKPYARPASQTHCPGASGMNMHLYDLVIVYDDPPIVSQERAASAVRISGLRPTINSVQ